MRIDILTVLPELVAPALDHSIVKRARERGLVTINVVNLRDYTEDRHRTTDDVPYGGGGGMVMKVEPIARALAALTAPPTSPPFETERASHASNEAESFDAENFAVEPSVAPSLAPNAAPAPRIVLTDPRGPRFTQETARQWASEPHLILICGHYEGVDERVRQHLVTDEVSIGDFILTGGELPALLIVDALTRLQSGAIGDAFGAENDTFTENLLEYPHFTRPRVYNGWETPEILLSGHHARIERWRRWHQLRATRDRRPDLFARIELSPQDRKLLDEAEPTAPPDARAIDRATPTPQAMETPEQASETPEQTAHPPDAETAADSEREPEREPHLIEEQKTEDGTGTTGNTGY